MVPDLVKVTEIFLVPSSFLVAALGTADTNPHRAGVSLLGLIVSILWWVGSRDALAEAEKEGPAKIKPARLRILIWLPVLFIIGWFISLMIHIAIWNRPTST
ncbi:MAG: hypothetical protein GC206_13185 [Alphaproteobacteria bacterium]|nr:hypothetical protein [Alphaproteobacteria bacterium]